MTHLHMRQFDGITVGMEVQSPAAFQALKKNITYGEVKPRGWSRPTKRRLVPAKYAAAAMGQAAWLVTEHSYPHNSIPQAQPTNKPNKKGSEENASPQEP